jgi:hypothetical protein
MKHIMSVETAMAYTCDTGSGTVLYVVASGTVPTSGWSNGQLSPRIYVTPPADGIWDFDFVAEEPHGIVLPVLSPISGSHIGTAPGWLSGVRVIAASNNVVKDPIACKTETFRGAMPAAKLAGQVIVEQSLAVYDDSFQPTGTIHWHNDGPFGIPTPHIEMKKLRHELTLVVEGPDEAKIRDCINSSLQAGAIAAIIAAFATGGWAAAEAFASAALSALTACLGDGFSATINDRSHWIYWDT